jgi:hypothetical protein
MKMNTPSYDDLVKTLKLIRHATALTQEDGAYHENAYDLADAALRKVEADSATFNDVDKRLRKIEQQMRERGLTLGGVTWADRDNAGTVEERKNSIADFMESFLRGDGTPLYICHDDLLTGEELVQRVHALEDEIATLREAQRMK